MAPAPGAHGGSRARIAAGLLLALALAPAGGCEDGPPKAGPAGRGPAAGASASPVDLDAPGAVELELPKSGTALPVSLGEFHSCAVRAGAVECRGSNVYGQLGGRQAAGHRGAVAVVGVTGAVAVAVGAKHSCALLGDATVHCWGLDHGGQTGHGSRQPAAVLGLRSVVQIAVGADHSCGLVKNGLVVCWGSNEAGQLGAGPAPRPIPLRPSDRAGLPAPRNAVPHVVDNLSAAVEIAAGARHSCARTADGSVWCWGDNRQGQLGLVVVGPPVQRARLVPAISGAVQIAAGGNQSCAVTSDGRVHCWGSYEGSFVAPAEPTPFPRLVPGLSEIERVAVGSTMGCAVRRDHALLCWKDGPTPTGDWYELGYPPRAVDGVAEAAAVGVGLTAACASQQSGEVLCWGRNPYGLIASAEVRRLRKPARYGDPSPEAGGHGGSAPAAAGTASP